MSTNPKQSAVVNPNQHVETLCSRVDNRTQSIANNSAPPIKAVLFDLDGTLADTAPDLVAALNNSLSTLGYAEVSLSQVQHAASHGSLALAKAAMPDATDEIHLTIQQGFLKAYPQVNGRYSQLYAGMQALLDFLDKYHLPYGIVTNKAACFSRPLIKALGLTDKMRTIISGDSTLYSKPHAAPMLLAAQQLACEPANILYLGDAERDLLAADNAAMQGGIAQWGYITSNDNPASWPARYRFNSADDIVKFLAVKL